jgi:hypothetical protein
MMHWYGSIFEYLQIIFYLILKKNPHCPFKIVLDHDMWHNKNLPHGILIVSILKAHYLMTCDAFKWNLMFNILIS